MAETKHVSSEIVSPEDVSLDTFVSMLHETVQARGKFDLPNRCVKVRSNVENKIYRMFSILQSRPSNEEDWTVLRTGEDMTLLVDKMTMAVLAQFECQWLTPAGSSVNLEPDVVAVEIRPK